MYVVMNEQLLERFIFWLEDIFFFFFFCDDIVNLYSLFLLMMVTVLLVMSIVELTYCMEFL